MASSRGARTAARLLVVLSLVPAAGAARAQSAADKETARSYMQEGRDLRDQKDLVGALRRFQAADAIMHVPTTGLEVARTQVMLGQLVEARDTISAIQRLPASPGDPPQFVEARKKADDLDASLDSRIPSVTVTIKVVPAGARVEVSIDGAPLPAPLLGLPHKVDPGHHVVVASAGGDERKQEVDLREREKKAVTLEFSAGSPAAPAPVAPTPAVSDEQPPAVTPSQRGWPLLVWTGFGVAGAGLVAGAVTGFLSMQKKSDLDSACTADRRCPPSAYDELDSANTLATISTISFVVAGVGAGVGVVGLFVRKPSAATSTGLTIEPWIAAGRAGLRAQF